MSGLFTLGFFIIGRSTALLGDFGNRSRNIVFKLIAQSVQKTYDLGAFDLRTRVVHHLPIYSEDIFYPTIYAICLVGILLVFSLIFFNRRDFK